MCSGGVALLKAIMAAALLFLAAACAQAPDLTGVEASFASGTAGAGATRTDGALAQSAFGRQITQAVHTSPSLARSSARIRAAEAETDAARGAFRPQLSVGANARTNRLDNNVATVSPYLRISQLVYDGGAATGDLTAARARVLESRGDQLQIAAATTLEAIEAYVMVLNQRKLLEIARRNVETHETLERQISTRTTSGAGSNADLLAAQSRMADARTLAADARARLDRAEARFREIFSAAPVGTLPTPQPAPPLTRSDGEIVADSPQVRRASASLKAAEAELAAAIARRNPSLIAGVIGNQDRDRDAHFEADLALNFDLDTTGQRRAAIKAAEARVEEAVYERERLTREIGRELGFIRSDQKAGAERLRAARIAASANADSVDAAFEQFTVGRRSLIEILDAQRDYVIAQESLILAEQNFFLTNYAALSLTGDILDVFGISLTGWEAPS
ncbi:MAG: TolC family protein [Pseudomonadota bacterium]